MFQRVHALIAQSADTVDGQRMRLSQSSSDSCDWQPDNKCHADHLQLFHVIKSLPRICEVPLWSLAACCLKNPWHFCYAPCHPLYYHSTPPALVIYSLNSCAFLFIYFYDFFYFISKLPHITSIKKITCTFIIFQFRATRFNLQDALILQQGHRYLHFD